MKVTAVMVICTMDIPAGAECIMMAIPADIAETAGAEVQTQSVTVWVDIPVVVTLMQKLKKIW